MKPRPDPDQLVQWVVRDGVPPGQVGARLGVSRATGYEWLRRYAIRAGGPAASQDELRAGWQSGGSTEQIAAETGLPAAAVAERLIAAGVLASSRPYVLVGTSADPLPAERLRRWHLEQGLSAGQIAAMTGTTIRQVRYRLSQYGLTRRRGATVAGTHRRPGQPGGPPPGRPPGAEPPAGVVVVSTPTVRETV